MSEVRNVLSVLGIGGLMLAVLIETGREVGEILAEEMHPHDLHARNDAMLYGRAAGAGIGLVVLTAIGLANISTKK